MLSALIVFKMFSFFECSGMPSRIRTWEWQCNLSRVVSCPSAAVACTRVLILWDYIKMSSGRLVKNLNWWA